MFYTRCYVALIIMGKNIIKAILRFLLCIGILTGFPMVIYFILTGNNMFELFENVEKL